MKKKIIGLIIGGIFGFLAMIFTFIVLGDFGPAWFGILAQILVFPVVILGHLTGGAANFSGGLIITFVLNIVVWAGIGYAVGSRK